MLRLLLLLLLPCFLFAQEESFQSPSYSASSANEDIYFDFEFNDLDTLLAEGRENEFSLRIEVRGISPKAFKQFLKEKRYELVFEGEHFKLPNWNEIEDLEEHITLSIKATVLYRWDEEKACLSWSTPTLIARSQLPFNYQYEVILMENELPATLPAPQVRD
jgi:hypothetical protein